MGMNFDEYQQEANRTNRYVVSPSIQDDPHPVMIPLVGLAGEAGTLLTEHQKWIRDGGSHKVFQERVTEESGNLLMHMSAVATHHNLHLGDIAFDNLGKIGALGDGEARGHAGTDEDCLKNLVGFNEYQQLAVKTHVTHRTGANISETDASLIPVLELFGKAGELLSDHAQWLGTAESCELYDERVVEQMGSLLWYLSEVNSKHGLRLEDAAQNNLKKISRRWNPSYRGGLGSNLLDEDYPEHERLPRQMDIVIKPDASGRSLTFVNGHRFGDPLADNHYDNDGYRFHDVFHLAFASILGWSPTVRALLRRKRKSNPEVDATEDGGRAIVLEEGISTKVFNYAARRNFLDGAGGVDDELLREIWELTEHLEVGERNAADWEQAILTGVELWREVRTAGEAHICADLEKGTIWIADTAPLRR